MRMLKTFFRDVTTQSKTAFRGEKGRGSYSKSNLSDIFKNNTKKKKRKTACSHQTLSLGSLLMVLSGRRTRNTRRDFIVLMSRPLLLLLTFKYSFK